MGPFLLAQCGETTGIDLLTTPSLTHLFTQHVLIENLICVRHKLDVEDKIGTTQENNQYRDYPLPNSPFG